MNKTGVRSGARRVTTVHIPECRLTRARDEVDVTSLARMFLEAVKREGRSISFHDALDAAHAVRERVFARSGAVLHRDNSRRPDISAQERL